MEQAAQGGATMIQAVTTGLQTVITWCGTVIQALLGADGQLKELLPLLAIGIGISALMLGVKIIRSFAWGA